MYYFQYWKLLNGLPFESKVKLMFNSIKNSFDGWTDYYLLPLILMFVILLIFFFLKSVYQHDAIYDNLRLNKVKYKYEEFKKEMKYTKCYDYKILNHNKPFFKSYYNNNIDIYEKKYSEEYTKDPSHLLNDNEYYHYLKYIKANQKYKLKYFPGVIGWMTSYFWVSFLLGIISYGGYNISELLFNGFMTTITIITLTGGILLIPTFIMGIIIHPLILKSTCFNDKYPMNEVLLKEMHYDMATEKLNIASVLGGGFLGKFLK